jgi:hypothetical protein
MRWVRVSLIVVLGWIALFGLARPVAANVFYVPCQVSALIDALREANRTSSSDTLELAEGCTYTLQKNDNDNGTGATGLPIINDDISINGNGAVIERNSASSTPLFRLFNISAKGILHLDQITLRNGKLAATGACPVNCGGAIYNAGSLEINNSTVAHNTASNGGAIYNLGKTDVTNTTLSDNAATIGGAILTNGNASKVVVVHATIASNTAEQGGSAIAVQARATALLRATLVAGNKGASCSGGVINGGYNLDSGTSCGWSTANGSMSNTDPQIGILVNNGGKTETVIILESSPAINAIPSLNGCGAGVYTDQRGGARPEVTTSLCDIGAVEVPEWDTLFLFGSGLGGLAIWLRAQRKRFQKKSREV